MTENAYNALDIYLQNPYVQDKSDSAKELGLSKWFISWGLNDFNEFNDFIDHTEKQK